MNTNSNFPLHEHGRNSFFPSAENSFNLPINGKNILAVSVCRPQTKFNKYERPTSLQELITHTTCFAKKNIFYLHGNLGIENRAKVAQFKICMLEV